MSSLLGAWSLDPQRPIDTLLDPDARAAMRAQLFSDVESLEHSSARGWLCAAKDKGVQRRDGTIIGAEGFVARADLPHLLAPERRVRVADDPPEGHFVLAEVRGDRLLLLRSLSGGERLYVARVGDLLLFGSSVRHVLAHPQVGRALRPEVVDEVLLNGHPMLGWHTPLSDVEEVPPGHALEADTEVHEPRWMWRSALRSPHGHPQRLARAFADALRASIERAIGRTRPVAVALSGGIDSAAVLAAAVDVVGADNIVAFSYEFDDPTHSRETNYADMVAKRLGVRDHRVFPIAREAFLASIPENVWRAENSVHWPKSFLLPVARHIAAEGFDHYITGFGVGSHMAYMRDVSPLLASPLWRRALLPLWRLFMFRRWPWMRELARLHPGLEPPHPRLYYTLLRVLEHDGLISSSAAGYPREMAALLGRLRPLPQRDPAATVEPLHTRLQLQAFAHMISCIDVTRSEKSSREVGMHRISPAHFAATIPYAYFPIEPAPTFFSAARRQRPGKQLLQLAFRGAVPDEVLFRVKSWGDAVASPAWLRAGRQLMLRALPRFPADLASCGSGQRGYDQALMYWEPRSILASGLSLSFWRRLQLERELSPRPPTWQELIPGFAPEQLREPTAGPAAARP